ncbi:unnamed protein product [Phytophthora fragariaefolia]|uniref:Unnamed protein product n=1 Tax=Phytophthora fragariaefolia TaxID=1490495 RepID=A0A9W6X800_9STRA|nr:unnamed protein product [Phytophthora fragariaefolia]
MERCTPQFMLDRLAPTCSLTAERKLLGLWFILGVLPLALQTRSYVQFAKPHKMPAHLVVASDVPKQTENLSEICPVTAFVLAGVWWNFEATHYYKSEQGVVCHAVVPQYNLHGNYFVGGSKAAPFRTSPTSCAGDSYPYEQCLYHGSIGYYSYYGNQLGTYCSKDRAVYIIVKVLGTFDINGAALAADTGNTGTRMSYWYGVVGGFWIMCRALMIRRSCISCSRYGQRCDELGETLHLQESMLYVQESLRLSAHGATNYQRVVLLCLVIEGIMSDLILIIGNDGWATKVQYASLGYNLSGLMLLLFEMLENTRIMREKWRLWIKRTFFSHDTALVGELVIALALQSFLSGLNGSNLRRSKETALAVSYYFWSLVGHGIVVLVAILIISSVRAPIALIYVWCKHHSFVVLSEPCCIDTVIGARSRIVLLAGYVLEDGKLYYTTSALKAFGMLKMEEYGSEYLVLHKLGWFTVPRENLVRIGVITGHRVEPCRDRPCSGIVTFLNRRLGGVSTQTECYHHTPNHNRVKVMVSGSERLDVIPYHEA